MDQLFDICWDNNIHKELKKIHKYLSVNVSEAYADKTISEIVGAAEPLRTQPERYPLEPQLLHLSEKYRFIKVGLYKMIYTFTGQEVIITHVFHSKQNPATLKKQFKK
jgi:plasmid stabilization system protein ParE